MDLMNPMGAAPLLFLMLFLALAIATLAITFRSGDHDNRDKHKDEFNWRK